jgi:hypothetical protein
MPFPRNEFDSGGTRISSIEQQVLDFLIANRDRAFAPEDIVLEMYGALMAQPDSPQVGAVKIALDHLVTQNSVLCKVFQTNVGDELYFAAA